MTLTLILLRHAKSDWNDASLDDHDRPLNKRGYRDAPRIGRWLAEKGLQPERALCSSARRAQETLEGLGLNTRSTILDELYMASPATLLKAIQGASHDRIIVVAHNPGIGALAHQLVRSAPEHPRFRDYPTAATLVAEFEAEAWSEIKLGTARVRDFLTPHDLPN